ncbi:carbohydrate sulfotransferase 11-like [Lytechinus variegatus]|uniref:carbohydrate sulfotransferase 11-like n=1 Tax=Lytechinus variegatus TaxID=7654 RepID=UPI001BB1D302|nr:carbohydrate sulfotransferase 11-like [Lytechinus variegatus]
MVRIGNPLFTVLFLATSSVILFSMKNFYDNYFFNGHYQRASLEVPKRLTAGINQNNVTQNTTIKVSVPLDDTQQQRRSHLLKTCEGLNARKHPENIDGLSADTLKKMDNIFVIDKFKTLYCYIPKVGCTTMKRMLLLLNGHINSTNVGHEEVHALASKYFPSLGKFSLEDAKEKIKNYRKLIFVREPFSRILSAYRDKLESKGSFKTNFLPRMVNRDARSMAGGNEGLNITFGNFIDYVSNPWNTLADPPEEHWREMFRLCYPCRVPYDFIGRFETFNEDIREGLQKITQDVDIEIPASSNPTKSSNLDTLVKYYSRLSSTQLESLYKRLATDIELFNYRVPSFLADRFFSS